MRRALARVLSQVFGQGGEASVLRALKAEGKTPGDAADLWTTCRLLKIVGKLGVKGSCGRQQVCGVRIDTSLFFWGVYRDGSRLVVFTSRVVSLMPVDVLPTHGVVLRRLLLRRVNCIPLRGPR